MSFLRVLATDLQSTALNYSVVDKIGENLTCGMTMKGEVLNSHFNRVLR
jgi:hypothetical protein